MPNHTVEEQLAQQATAEQPVFVKSTEGEQVAQIVSGGLRGVEDPSDPIFQAAGGFSSVQNIDPAAFAALQTGEAFRLNVPDEPTATEVADGAALPGVEFPEEISAIQKFEQLNQEIANAPEIQSLIEDRDAALAKVLELKGGIEARVGAFAPGQKEEIVRDAFAEFEIETFQAALSVLRDEAADIEAQRLGEVNAASAGVAQASFVRGNVARIENAFQVRKAGVALRQQATAQNLQAAQSLASSIVNAKTADLDEERNFTIQMINLNADLFESLSTKARDRIQDRLTFISSEIAQQQIETTNIVNLMMQSPGAKIDPVIDTFETAAIKAQAWQLGEPERALEQARKETAVNFIARMQATYFDAGIDINDSPDAARDKVLKNSSIFGREVRATEAQIAATIRSNRPSADGAAGGTATERAIAALVESFGGDAQAAVNTIVDGVIQSAGAANATAEDAAEAENKAIAALPIQLRFAAQQELNRRRELAGGFADPQSGISKFFFGETGASVSVGGTSAEQQAAAERLNREIAAGLGTPSPGFPGQ